MFAAFLVWSKGVFYFGKGAGALPISRADSPLLFWAGSIGIFGLGIYAMSEAIRNVNCDEED